MSPGDREGDGDRPYEVGYGRPPQSTRFKKGQSGNPKGRPKAKKKGPTDPARLLSAPIKGKIGDKTVAMSPFEASIRRMAWNALDNDLQAIIRFIRLCEEYEIIVPPLPNTGGGVLTVPKGVDFEEWCKGPIELVSADQYYAQD